LTWDEGSDCRLLRKTDDVRVMRIERENRVISFGNGGLRSAIMAAALNYHAQARFNPHAASHPPRHNSSISYPRALETTLTPRRFRRPRILLCRNLPAPPIPKSPLSRPYNPHSREPRIPPNHPSIRILR
jgi:hypothetical protein